MAVDCVGIEVFCIYLQDRSENFYSCLSNQYYWIIGL